MRAAFDPLGGRRPGWRWTASTGSRRRAAGLLLGRDRGRASLLARALVAGGAERLDDAAVLRLAAEIEGHPDNVAPCLLGGFTIAWTEPAGAPGGAGSAPAAGVRPMVFVPAERGPDRDTPGRRCRPTVPHADAAFNAGRAALLVHALTAEPACCWRPPRTGCTRTTGRRACRTRAAWSAALRAAGVRGRGQRGGADRAGA